MRFSQMAMALEYYFRKTLSDYFSYSMTIWLLLKGLLAKLLKRLLMKLFTIWLLVDKRY